jgi:1-acyl-sn-glycerol-3-phosphate acyltransferase
MIYNFLQFFVNLGLRFYFRSIYFINEEAIPEGQPVLITANHSNSAFDALLISGLYKRKDLYWLARGDVFNNKWVAKFMAACKTAPIYRSSEVGFVDVKRNNESFKVCFDLLDQNKMIGIFPEGITIPERKLQVPFKKGFARLAFQAHEKIGRPIMIVPVGVSYHSLVKTRTDVFVKFGKPFSTELFYEDYLANNANGLKNITHYLEKQLDENIVNYDSVENQKELNQHLYFGKKNREGKLKEFGFTRDESFYEIDRKIVNYFIDKQKGDIETDLTYENTLKANKINLDLQGSKLNVIMAVLAPLLIGMSKIIYFLPNQLSKYIIKTKVKKPAFWGTSRFIILYLAFPLFIVLLSLLALPFSKWVFFGILLGFPLIVFLGLRLGSMAEES